MSFFKKDRIKNLKTYLFEVLVIFTAITASFLFDEWRQDRERINLEHDYLLRLDADLGNDIEALQGMTECSHTQLTYCETAIKSMNGDTTADTIFSYVTGICLFELNDYTITEMQSTGVFYSIENTQLKNEILHYYRSAGEMMFVYNAIIVKNDAMQNELNNYLKLTSDKNNFGRFDVVRPIEGNLRLENLIYAKKNYLEFLLFSAPDLATKAESLRVTIKNALGS